MLAISKAVERLVAPGWPELDERRSDFEREFARCLRETPQVRGRVLDIGCGANVPSALRGLTGVFGSLDGVDPDPGIAGHPLLVARWHGRLESMPVPAPAQAYDLAYAYNVLEHIAEPRPFFARVASVLKPGGVFLAIAPNAHHPFAQLSRAADVLRVKPLARRALGGRAKWPMQVNEYPAYYRCNSPRSVRRAIEGLGFSSATFAYVPSVQWDRYFPPSLRWAPRAWDCLVSTRVRSMSLMLIVRLEKGPARPADP